MSVPGELMALESRPSLSLTELYRTHSERVFRAAYRVTGSVADAEDVLQGVFVRILHQTQPGGRWDALEDPGRYLSRSAINAGLDILRSRRRAVIVNIEDARDAVEGELESMTAEAGAESAELRDQLH